MLNSQATIPSGSRPRSAPDPHTLTVTYQWSHSLASRAMKAEKMDVATIKYSILLARTIILDGLVHCRDMPKACASVNSCAKRSPRGCSCRLSSLHDTLCMSMGAREEMAKRQPYHATSACGSQSKEGILTKAMAMFRSLLYCFAHSGQSTATTFVVSPEFTKDDPC